MIITVSREFGSGGREFAKRLADELGYKYLDKEIITRMSKAGGLDEEYIKRILVIGSEEYSATLSHSFSMYNAIQQNATDLRVLENKIIKQCADEGNCVIVGRGADIVLENYDTIDIFLYASMESKIKRCIEKSQDDKTASAKEMERIIKKVDSARSTYYLLIGGDKWGDKGNYDICLNTTSGDIKGMAHAVAQYIKTIE